MTTSIETPIRVKLKDGRELDGIAECDRVRMAAGDNYDHRDPRHSPAEIDGDLDFYLDDNADPEVDLYPGDRIPDQMITSETFEEAEVKILESTPTEKEEKEDRKVEEEERRREERDD
jgi:hypothetical protein